MTTSIYDQLKAADVPLDHHESDLHAKVTPVSVEIIATYEHRVNVKTFHSETDGGALWYGHPVRLHPLVGSEGTMTTKTRTVSKVVTWEVQWRPLVARRNRAPQRIESNENILDMLRYDVAFANDSRPGIILTVRYTAPGRGTHRETITTGRWESYGCQIAAAPEAEAMSLDMLRAAPDDWYTMRTKRTEYGLERVTFAAWIAEDTTR